MKQPKHQDADDQATDQATDQEATDQATDQDEAALDAMRGHPHIAAPVVAAFELILTRLQVIETLAGVKP